MNAVHPQEAMEPGLLCALVAQQAARTPHAVAVVDAERRATYAQLDARANQLAHYLVGRGVGPDTRVGTCLYRGVDLVVALLGIWRAGAAYLPGTPDLPPRRFAGMLADADVRLVLTETECAGTVCDAGAVALTMGGICAELDALPTTAPPNAAGPDDAAYVLYTSGTSGRPKGVVVTNAGIANRVAWAVRPGGGLTSADRVLHKTPVTFDAHCWEVFAPLVCGGTLVLAAAGAEIDPAAMARDLRTYQVTTLQIWPSALRLLVEEPELAACGALRRVFSAGEPLDTDLVRRLEDRLGRSVELWNTYGPTECSIDVTAYRVSGEEVGPQVPIGRPLPGFVVRVLDELGRPTAAGRAGELYVGGVGVARGYLGRPDLTGAYFLPDEQAADGSRIYRTGDRVRWTPAGELEFLGRVDDQVKVDGVRIEPVEIEQVLRDYPGIEQAAVTAYVGSDGSKRLAAHLVADAGLVVNPESLIEHLGRRLSGAQIPTSFLLLDHLPFGPNGKLDRFALPAPGSLDATGRPVHRIPIDRFERLVAETWRGVLGVSAVGLDDEFFQLGGSSMQLARMVSQLREQTATSVPLGSFFSAKTPAAQAQVLADASRAEADRPLVLSFAQRRLWSADRLNPQNLELTEQIVLAVPAAATIGDVRSCLDALVARHEALRTRYLLLDGEPAQLVDPPGPVYLRTAEATDPKQAATLLRRLIAEERRRGFDLTVGPLLRAVAVENPGGPMLAAVALHRLAADPRSAVILADEFAELLAARTGGQDAALPPKPPQYADFVRWEREQEGERLERELDRWCEHLKDLTKLDLPTDMVRPSVRAGQGAAVPLTIPTEQTRALAELAREHRASPFAVLLTAFALTLARHTGQWDLSIGTQSDGRVAPGTERTVGYFSNDLVLRCTLDPEDTFAAAVDAVKQTTTTAFAHRHLPFGELVERLDPDAGLSRTPLFQVAFELHDRWLGVPAGFDRAARTDLALVVGAAGDGSMTGRLEYDAALFAEAGIARMANHLSRMIEQAANRTDLPLRDFELFDSRESARIEARSTGPSSPGDAVSVLELFADGVAAHPDAIAASGPGFTGLSYGELDAEADRLAASLRVAGVGPETVVGVLLDRGPRLFIALLAAWKAGGAYLPLDPVFPAERIDLILAEAEARVLVSEGAYAAVWRTQGPADGPTLIDLDRAEDSVSWPQDTLPAADPPDPEQLAYVLFASGSTGRPEGVAVTHGGLARHIAWAVETLCVGRHAHPPTSALLSSVACGSATAALWAPLVSGGRVHVLPQGQDDATLGQALSAGGPFAFLHLTPSHLAGLTGQTGQLAGEQAGKPADFVIVTGEPLPAATADRWAGRLGPSRLLHAYGPAETAVAAALPLSAPLDSVRAPIGRPLPGTTLRLLDQALRRVPEGVRGELYIGGPCLARGYLGRPTPTAERFLPDPYGPPGARMYRTGDYGRMREDGTIELLGRRDDRVEIRGHRVEPNEVRSVLLPHPGVRDAVVLPFTREDESSHKPGAPGNVALAAYVVGSADPASLTAHCAAALPGPLVPAVYLPVPEIPWREDGEPDRAALPDPRCAAPAAGRAPSTEVERVIAQLFTDLLGRAPASVHESFFDLGGGSITAIRLVADLQDLFHLELPIRTVFESRTVAALARAVEARIRAEIDRLSDEVPVPALTRRHGGP